MSDILKGKNTFKRADAGHRYFFFARAKNEGKDYLLNKGGRECGRALRIITLTINPNSPLSLH